jgi:hypothetical protein
MPPYITTAASSDHIIDYIVNLIDKTIEIDCNLTASKMLRDGFSNLIGAPKVAGVALAKALCRYYSQQEELRYFIDLVNWYFRHSGLIFSNSGAIQIVDVIIAELWDIYKCDNITQEVLKKVRPVIQ